MKTTLVGTSMIVLGAAFLILSLFLMIQDMQYQAAVVETWKAAAIYNCESCTK